MLKKFSAASVICLLLSQVALGCKTGQPAQTTPSDLSSQPPLPQVSATIDPDVRLNPSPSVSVPNPQTPPTPTGALPTPPSFPLTGIEMGIVDPKSLDLAVEAGAFWIRRNSLKWSLVEPDEGQRSWGAIADLEQELSAIHQRGSQALLIVSSTPSWAQGFPGYFCGPVAPDKLFAFARFMYDTVQRFSAPPFEVKYWEFGNEPDIDPSLVAKDSIFGCWGDRADSYYGGGYYAEMLKQVYPQIKAADPDAQVLVGGLLLDCDPVSPPEGKDCRSSLFIEGILRGGGGDYFDGISYHAYDYYTGGSRYANSNWHSSWDSTGPVLISKARYLRSLLASYQKTDKYLINSEAGLLCGSAEDQPVCQSREFGLTKSYYTIESNLAAQAEGLRSNIWYSLYGWRGTGLVDPQNQPVPAYVAYGFVSRQLFGMAVIRLFNEVPGIRGYELAREGRRLMILWSTDGQDHPYEFEQLPAAIYNVFGEQTRPTEQITIGRQPIYVEW